MARPVRIEYPGAVYYISSKGRNGNSVYTAEPDGQQFLALLNEVCERYQWSCYAYCMLQDRYQLLIKTPRANLAKGMRQLNGIYTTYMNRTYNREGPLFQGRYKSIVIDSTQYLLPVARHIVLSPVRAGFVQSAKAWRWSSYRETAGDGQAILACLDQQTLLMHFSPEPDAAQQAYLKYIKAGVGQPPVTRHAKHQVYLGDAVFIARVKEAVAHHKAMKKYHISLQDAVPKRLKEYALTPATRNEVIANVYQSGQYSLKALGDHFGLHYSRVSRIISRQREKNRSE